MSDRHGSLSSANQIVANASCSRISTLKSARDLAQASLERIAEQARASSALTPERITAFASLLNEKLTTADAQARKAYLRAVISEIRVDDDRIQIIGDKANLAAVVAGQQTAAGKVSGFVRKWRSLRESNPPLQRERLPS